MPFSIIWTHAESYRDQRARILNDDSTFRADDFIGLPGFCSNVWLSPVTAEIVHRSAHPCPKGMRYFNRCRTVRLILNRAWGPNYFGAYAGVFVRSDLLVEFTTVDLVIDCGEPARCHFVHILTGSKLLVAEKSEFDLGEYYWADRALLRSTLIA